MQDIEPLISLDQFQSEIEKLYNWSKQGCLNGNCQIKKPTGMHTNASCFCNPRDFADQLLWLACELDKYSRKRWMK